MQEKVKALSDYALKEMLEEIYDFKYVSGVLKEGSVLRQFAKDNRRTVNDVEPYILDEGAERYKKTVTLLMDTRSYKFLKF